MKLYSIFFTVLLFTISSCKKTTEYNSEKIEEDLQKIARTFVPDKRVGIADISVNTDGETGNVAISIKSDFKQVLDSIRNYTQKLPFKADTSFLLLPNNEALEGKTQAVVNISVANIRSQPKHSAELATKATLGTPLKVLEKEGSWFRVQTPDNYISWVDAGGIVRYTPEEYSQWLKHSKIVVTTPTTYAYENPNLASPLVSDLTGGNVLKLIDKTDTFYKVEFPDQRQGFVAIEDAQVYAEWLSNLSPTSENLIKVSKQMMGVPYLWGGTSFKGVDCSGFTKTIYFMNGMVIPRDASQQVHAGREIDTSNGFEELQAGDLLFFGRKATDEQKEKVVHVAMWLGNNEFIHASGMVRINSFDPKAPNYNEYELNRFLRAKRFLNYPQELITKLEEKELFFRVSE